MEQMERRIEELADIMSEFNLAEARLQGDDWKVAFRRNKLVAEVSSTENGQMQMAPAVSAAAPEPAPAKPAGTPVTSPMNGIYYTAPSPSAPPFVKEGELVTAGQVVGLIEAMKVFNEITAPVSGTVAEMKAESGQLVHPGEVLLYIQ